MNISHAKSRKVEFLNRIFSVLEWIFGVPFFLGVAFGVCVFLLPMIDELQKFDASHICTERK